VIVLGSGNPKPAGTIKTGTTEYLGRVVARTTGIDRHDGRTGKVTDIHTIIEGLPWRGNRPFAADTTVDTPITGGPGTYTTTISSVPEASSWVLGLLGGLGMLSYAWASQKAARV
jgi:hypothetical protein